jgi:hypothetical protein
MDGVKVGERSDAQHKSIGAVKVAPTWGGNTGDRMSTTGYLYFDDLQIRSQGEVDSSLVVRCASDKPNSLLYRTDKLYVTLANAWQMFGLERQVAMYVRTLVAVEGQVNNASLLGKLLQQEDRLGLTPAGQARNLWIIAAEGKVEPVADDPEAPAPRTRKQHGPTAKERLAGQGLGVLDGGA